MTNKTHDNRQLVWRHNSFFGYCAMAESNMRGIINAHTTTKEAKTQADLIILELNKLYALLRTRVSS